MKKWIPGAAISVLVISFFLLALSGCEPLSEDEWIARAIELGSPIYYISTVAGTGTSGYSGDGGAAISAALSYPCGIAIASNGSIYIADSGNHCVRRIDSDGIITTVAGTGTSGYSGDGGPATDAELDSPGDIAIDSSGIVYILDRNNDCIRGIDADGIIHTMAGTGEAGFSGDDSQAVNATLNGPRGITLDSEGNLYIADTENNRIRKVDTDGIITTVAGPGSWGYAEEGVQAILAELNSPTDVAVDVDGNLYITDSQNYIVRKIDSEGIIWTVAGGGDWSALGNDGRKADTVRFGSGDLLAISFDSEGNYYITFKAYYSIGGYYIFKVDTDGRIMKIAGDTQDTYSGDDVPAAYVLLDILSDAAIGSDGTIYAAESGNNVIRAIYLK